MRADLLACDQIFVNLIDTHHRHCRGEGFYMKDGMPVGVFPEDDSVDRQGNSFLGIGRFRCCGPIRNVLRTRDDSRSGNEHGHGGSGPQGGGSTSLLSNYARLQHWRQDVE